MGFRIGAVVALLLMVGACAGDRQPPLPAATGETVLTVTGNIARPNQGGMAVLDDAILESLPQHEIVTTTPWTEGPQTFSGVRARDLMARLGVTGTAVRAVALDDYAVEIPITDFYTYNVLLARTQNGEPLPMDGMGPLWVVYPRDQFPELQTEEMDARWIWQLTRLEIQ